MHAQTLLCGVTAAAGRSGSSKGTLRARMHAQALLCGTTVTASCPGSGVGTLQARRHADTLLARTLKLSSTFSPRRLLQQTRGHHRACLTGDQSTAQQA
jgi:hypothetical protein